MRKITITLENHGFAATFQAGNPWEMPAGIPLPLPFVNSCPVGTVASDLLTRFAGSIVTTEIPRVKVAFADLGGVRVMVRRPRGAYRRR
jgi:hypothetical protein